MEIIEGIKRKFASANCKLIRICTITGNVEKLEKLLTDNKEIEVGKVQYDGKTPLQLAVTNCYFYVVRYLVEQMAVNVDELSDIGQTALHIACANDLIDIASYLISVNAALEICDQNGKVPADLCGTPDFKRLLQKAVVRSKGANLVPTSFHQKKLPKDQIPIMQLSAIAVSTDSSYSTESATSPIPIEPIKLKAVDLISTTCPVTMRPLSGRPMSMRPISVINRDSIRSHAANNQIKRILPPSVKTSTSNFDLDDFEGENTDPKALLSLNIEVAHVHMNDFDEEESADIDGPTTDESTLIDMDQDQMLPLLNAA